MPPFSGCLLIHGPDAYRRGEAVQSAIDARIAPEHRDFDYQRLGGQGLTPATLSTALETPPLLAPARLVHIVDAELLSPAAVLACAAVLDRLAARNDQTVAVILVHGGEKAPPKELQARAATVEAFPALARGTAVSWLREYATRRHRLAFAPDVATAIVDALGPEASGELANEVDKLVAMTGGKGVTLEDVALATGRTADESPYPFYDAIGARRYVEARARLVGLLAMPDYPGVRLVIGIGIHLANVGFARAKLDAGERPQAVAQAIGGWGGSKAVDQARHWTLPALDAALVALADADRFLKSGGDDRRTLDWFLTQALLDITAA